MLSALLLTACTVAAQDVPLGDRVSAERIRNEAAYRKVYVPQRKEMRKRHAKKWLVIVAGRVLPTAKGALAPAKTLAEVDRLARKVAPKARHRFVFRIGAEGDRERSMGACELNHVAGTGFMAEMSYNFVIASGTVYVKRKGKLVSIGAKGPDGRPFIAPTVSAPGSKKGKSQLFCVATGFNGDVTLSRRVGKQLGLELWEIPGRTTIKGLVAQKGDCRRAYARFDFGESRVVGTVPVSIWMKERKADKTEPAVKRER